MERKWEIIEHLDNFLAVDKKHILAHIHPYTQIYTSKRLHALCKATVTEKLF